MISQQPDIRARDIAAATGLTERSTLRILADLRAAGYLDHERRGRRNHYTIRTRQTLRHPHEEGVEVGLLLDLFSDALGDPSPNDGAP